MNWKSKIKKIILLINPSKFVLTLCANVQNYAVAAVKRGINETAHRQSLLFEIHCACNVDYERLIFSLLRAHFMINAKENVGPWSRWLQNVVNGIRIHILHVIVKNKCVSVFIMLHDLHGFGRQGSISTYPCCCRCCCWREIHSLP